MNILRASKQECVFCKENKSFCPIHDQAAFMKNRVKQAYSEHFSGPSPAPFVGRQGYPNLNLGIVNVPDTDEAVISDDPRYWASKNFTIPRVVDIRTSMLNSRKKTMVKPSTKTIDYAQEVAMASRPAEVEVHLKSKPHFRMSVDPYLAPLGAVGTLVKAKVSSNPLIDTRVDKVHSETDLKAAEAISYLYKHEFDENYLSKLLSVGTIGVASGRKLVPTRWSITAVDDTLGKEYIKKIKDYKEADNLIYSGGYLGNYFMVMLFSDVWSYELFETYSPQKYNSKNKAIFTTDYEAYEGRKSYVTQTAGGYYASRLPILEKLNFMKRQASVLVFRFITSDYAVPLGVWVVREAVRKTMSSKPVSFESKEELKDYVTEKARKDYQYKAEDLFKDSILYRKTVTQKKLTQF